MEKITMDQRFRRGTRTFMLLALSALALLLIAGCASTPVVSNGGGGTPGSATATAEYPEWYLNPQSVYPDDEFLTAVGTGDTRRDAEQQALSGISQTFEAQVSVDSRTSERYRELMSAEGTMSETEIRLAEDTSVESNQTLLNVQYGEAAVDEQGRVHVIAYLERLPTSQVYRDLITRNGRQVDRFLTEAEESDGIIREYAYTSAAAVVASSNEVLIDQLNIIVPGMARTVQLPYVFDDVIQRRADIASRMGVSVSVAGDTDGRVTSILRQALSDERFPLVDSGSTLSVEGVISINEIPSNADFQSVRWTVSLGMIGPDGRSLVNYDEENRASGISQEAARAFAYQDIEEAVSRDFVSAMRGYFDGLVLQN
ncbi:MAG: LPP20 family lipoprotein [Alkalispirochaeta sp.]